MSTAWQARSDQRREFLLQIQKKIIDNANEREMDPTLVCIEVSAALTVQIREWVVGQPSRRVNGDEQILDLSRRIMEEIGEFRRTESELRTLATQVAFQCLGYVSDRFQERMHHDDIVNPRVALQADSPHQVVPPKQG